MSSRVLALAILLGVVRGVAASAPEEQGLFVGGQGGYHTYRIPALAVMPGGTVIALAEGRKTSRSDSGDIDLVMRRSTDHGQNWSDVRLVYEDGGAAPITIGNPTPVVDHATGTLHVLFSRNNQRLFVMASRDDGATFSEPREITAAARAFDFDWTRLGPGPTAGVQLPGGRLLAPIWLNAKIGDPAAYRAGALASDDHGATWQAGKVAPVDAAIAGVNESAVVLLADGSLYMTQREGAGRPARSRSRSTDGGRTWSPAEREPGINPAMAPVKTGIAVYPTPDDGKCRVVYSAPGGKGRAEMTVWLSVDGAATWPIRRQISAGPAAYSELAVAADKTILLAYERGRDGPYEKIALARLTLAWLTEVRQTMGPGLHLFVDDVMLARRTGLTRRAYPCEKLDAPMLRAEMPWESTRVYVYGSARFDAQRGEFLLWYMSRGAEASLRDPRLPPGDLIMFATSSDGTHWRRPNLGRFTFAGDSANNIVFAMHSPSVLFDAEEPDPGRRYKMLGHLRGGCRTAFSPDGLGWTLSSQNPVIAGGDTVTLSYHPATHEYLAFFKRPANVRGYARRSVYVAASKDFERWSDPQLVMAPDEEDDRWAKTPPQRTEFYNMSVFPRGGQFLGLLTVFKLQRIETGPRSRDQSSHDGPIDVQLVYARDPRRWSRCDDRGPVIPRGPAAYDAGSILGVSNIPVIHDDRMWFYYTAMTTTHGGTLPEKQMSVGRASWRLDGMVSLRAGEEDAVLETVPLAPGVRRLEVNADASRGRLVVEVLDAAGNPVPGYTAEDCAALTADCVHHPVRWAAHEQLPDASGLRLRLRLRSADVFSLTLGL